jgi:hypothetical protein
MPSSYEEYLLLSDEDKMRFMKQQSSTTFTSTASNLKERPMTEQERDEMIENMFGMVDDMHTILTISVICVTGLVVGGVMFKVAYMVLRYMVSR